MGSIPEELPGDIKMMVDNGGKQTQEGATNRE